MTITTPIEVKTEIMNVRLDRVHINDVLLTPGDDGTVVPMKVTWGDLYDGKVELRFGNAPCMFEERDRVVTVVRTTVALNT